MNAQHSSLGHRVLEPVLFKVWKRRGAITAREDRCLSWPGAIHTGSHGYCSNARANLPSMQAFPRRLEGVHINLNCAFLFIVILCLRTIKGVFSFYLYCLV